jgi:hypothetical protein
MTKKFIVIGLTVILFAGLVTAAVLFFFQYKIKQSPQVDNSGSTTTLTIIGTYDTSGDAYGV